MLAVLIKVMQVLVMLLMKNDDAGVVSVTNTNITKSLITLGTYSTNTSSTLVGVILHQH